MPSGQIAQIIAIMEYLMDFFLSGSYLFLHKDFL